MHTVHRTSEDEKSSPGEEKMKQDEDGSKESSSLQSPAAIPGGYGSTPAQDKSASRCYIPCCGLILYLMAFLGIFCAMSLRTSLSEAIVAMVNQTAVGEDAVSGNVSDVNECPRDPDPKPLDGELVWDRYEQGLVLAAFYYGYLFTQIPGGWLADRFGGKWFFGGCILVSSVVALLTPTAARIHIGVLAGLRVLSGLGEGVLLPSVHALLARWSPPARRSLIVSIIFAGIDAGTAAGMLLSGYLCDYGFAGGWPSVFYVFGIIGCVWSVLWFLLCYNSPSAHPRISKVEREYWERVIGPSDLAAHPPTPWRKILTSVPVWALAIAFFADDWGFYTVATCIPLFVHDVLGFNMLENGISSACSFLISAILNPVSGFLADWLRSPGKRSTSVVRKVFVVSGFTVSGCCLVVLSYIGCRRVLAVTLICVAVTGSALSNPTLYVNVLDLAPLQAGEVMGLVYTVVTVGAIGAPELVSALTEKRSTSAQWLVVFYIAAAIYAVGGIVFVVFGSGKRQSWAAATDDDHEYELTEKQRQPDSE